MFRITDLAIVGVAILAVATAAGFIAGRVAFPPQTCLQHPFAVDCHRAHFAWEMIGHTPETR